jgi:hypothetical protein
MSERAHERATVHAAPSPLHTPRRYTVAVHTHEIGRLTRPPRYRIGIDRAAATRARRHGQRRLTPPAPDVLLFSHDTV